MSRPGQGADPGLPVGTGWQGGSRGPAVCGGPGADRHPPDRIEELVDVVDEHDVPIRVVTRAAVRANNLRHRVVFVIVRAGDGRILVHRRSDTKDLWPGRWDCAVGGVVAAGETYDAAAVRELGEELGVAGNPQEVGWGSYRDTEVNVVGRVFEIEHDGPFTYRDGEVAHAEFVTRDKLDMMLVTLQFVPDTIAIARAAGAL